MPEDYESHQIFIVTDSLGNAVWQWKDPSDALFVSTAVKVREDGSFYGCGFRIQSVSNAEGFKYIGAVAKYAANHMLEWEYNEGVPSAIDYFYDVKETANGDYVACGTQLDLNAPYHRNGWIVRLDANGQLIWSRQYRGVEDVLPPNEENMLTDIEELPDGSLVACGNANGTDSTNAPYGQTWLLRIDANGCLSANDCGVVEVEELSIVPQPSYLRILPNPVADHANIEVSHHFVGGRLLLTNVLGEVVLQQIVTTTRCQLVLSNYPSGIYFISTENAEGTKLTRRVVKE